MGSCYVPPAGNASSVLTVVATGVGVALVAMVAAFVAMEAALAEVTVAVAVVAMMVASVVMEVVRVGKVEASMVLEEEWREE